MCFSSIQIMQRLDIILLYCEMFNDQNLSTTDCADRLTMDILLPYKLMEKPIKILFKNSNKNWSPKSNIFQVH